MDNPLSEMNWIESDEMILDLSDQEKLTFSPLESGLEAEVIRISSNHVSWVLKVWNKESKPDVQYLYHLLQSLHEQGLSVSKPIGWGRNRHSHQVLLTRFDGVPIRKVNPKMITELAVILSDIHKFPAGEMDDVLIRKYDFVAYFYPGVAQFPDLHQPLLQLVERSGMRQDRMIHGDFHLGNILDQDGQYTVIDWTNGQLGDPRYDLAWASTLMKIYLSERINSMFLSAYLQENEISQEEMQVFEAIACVRWILLHRTVGLPKQSNTMKKVKSILFNNVYLNEDLLQKDKKKESP